MSDPLLKTGGNAQSWTCRSCGRRVRRNRTGPYCGCATRDETDWQPDRIAPAERLGPFMGKLVATAVLVGSFILGLAWVAHEGLLRIFGQ